MLTGWCGRTGAASAAQRREQLARPGPPAAAHRPRPAGPARAFGAPAGRVQPRAGRRPASRWPADRAPNLNVSASRPPAPAPLRVLALKGRAQLRELARSLLYLDLPFGASGGTRQPNG